MAEIGPIRPDNHDSESYPNSGHETSYISDVGEEPTPSSYPHFDGNEERSARVSVDPQRPKHPEACIKARLLIHAQQVGAVIGRSGERIKTLRKTHNAVIELISESENPVPERVLTLSGTIRNLLNLLRELLPCLNENPPNAARRHQQQQAQQVKPNTNMIRLLVHFITAGSIIGQGGRNIRQIREQSGSHITMYQHPCPGSSERIMLASGTYEQIMGALTAALDAVAETDIRGQNYPYNPLVSYDPNAYKSYGGFAMLDAYGQEMRQLQPPATRQSSIHPPYPAPYPGYGAYPGYPPMPMPGYHPHPPYHGGGGRGTKRRQHDITDSADVPPLVADPAAAAAYSYSSAANQSSITPSAKAPRYYDGTESGDSASTMPPNLLESPYSTMTQGAAAAAPPSYYPYSYSYPTPGYAYPGHSGPRASAPPPSGMPPNEPPPLLAHNAPPLMPSHTETEQYTIPPEAAGAVIGPKGKRAAFVRQTTGARVTISDDITKSGNRIITLAGTKPQVDAAKHYMRSFLSEYYHNQQLKRQGAGSEEAANATGDHDSSAGGTGSN